VVDAVLREWEWSLWLSASRWEQDWGYVAARHLYEDAERRCDQVGWWRSTWPA
jgi:hypothetical protein